MLFYFIAYTNNLEDMQNMMKYKGLSYSLNTSDRESLSGKFPVWNVCYCVDVQASDQHLY